MVNSFFRISYKTKKMRNQKTDKGIKDKYKYSTSQLFNFTQDSYLERTSRPFYAVVFLLPFIIFYEIARAKRYISTFECQRTAVTHYLVMSHSGF